MEATRKRVKQQSRTPRVTAEAPVERSRIRVTTVNDIEAKPKRRAATAPRKPRRKTAVAPEAPASLELEEDSIDGASISSSERRRLAIPRLHREGHSATGPDDTSDDMRPIIKTDIDFESLICDRHSGKVIYYDPIKNIIYDKNYEIVGEVDVNDGEFLFYRADFHTGEPLDDDKNELADIEEEYDYERVGQSDEDESGSDEDCD
jgi:hypothetical protein